MSHQTILDHLVETYLKQREYFKDDSWWESEAAVDELYNVHLDFRRFPTPPGARYVELYHTIIKPLVDSGAITFMPKEQMELSHIFCFERGGVLCVIDGSLRVFNAIQHGVVKLPMYLWDDRRDDGADSSGIV